MLLSAMLATFATSAIAQKFYEENNLHLSLEAPLSDGWNKSSMTTTEGDKEGYTGCGVAAMKADSTGLVEVICRYEKTDVENFITEIASKNIHEAGLTSIYLKDISDAKILKNKAKFLSFDGSDSNQTFTGGVYGFVKDDCTYTIYYFSTTNADDIALVEKILNTIRIEKPANNSSADAALTKQAEKEKENAEKEKKKIEKEKKKLEKEVKQAEEAKEKAIKEKKAAAKQQEKELKKQKVEAKKAQKAADAKEKELKKQKKEAKKAAKEQLKAIEEQQDALDEEAKALKEQQKAIKEPTKKQKKDWKEAEKRIKEKRKALKDRKNEIKS
jgi:hypothetical protein